MTVKSWRAGERGNRRHLKPNEANTLSSPIETLYHKRVRQVLETFMDEPVALDRALDERVHRLTTERENLRELLEDIVAEVGIELGPALRQRIANLLETT